MLVEGFETFQYIRNLEGQAHAQSYVPAWGCVHTFKTSDKILSFHLWLTF